MLLLERGIPVAKSGKKLKVSYFPYPVSKKPTFPFVPTAVRFRQVQVFLETPESIPPLPRPLLRQFPSKSEYSPSDFPDKLSDALWRGGFRALSEVRRGAF